MKAQKPIRILDAIQWDDDIKQHFFAANATQLPRVDVDYYRTRRPLHFDIDSKRMELHGIERDIMRQLGQLNPVGAWLRRFCREYLVVVEMLAARGTAQFSQLSQELYGSSSDVFHAGDPTVAELASRLQHVLQQLILHSPAIRPNEKTFDATAAVKWLNQRLRQQFPGCGIRARISDGIVADAAAGSDTIKLRADATFSESELRILEAHEGWVHIGTSLNGARQPVCTFLAKGPPSATITQEGLAVMTETLSMQSTPHRLSRLTRRVQAVALVEDGADFVALYRYLLASGSNPDDAWQVATRVFRGSAPALGPFTKDLSYIKGFVLAFNYVRLAIARGTPERIHLLFCGKTTIDDMKTVAELVSEGAILPPQYLPPLFEDLTGLSACLSFTRFASALDFSQLEHDYSPVF
ncbi:MAG TPA: flavohemoglobin expression-modulating QEGLA motif protein [Spongiibacteraceae bacterium]